MKVTFRPHHLFSRFHDWAHVHPKRTYFFVALGILVSLGLIAGAVLYKKPAPEAPPKPVVKVVKKPAPVYYSPLTGVKVADVPATKQAVTAIMIENSPDARPHSGLKNSGIVFEAVAEGGITRFLALYQEDKPQLVGPVRSLRMYYVDWLAPYQASVAHVGGSAAALAEIRSGGYRDIDQFFNPGTYWRASDRYAPHNMYTSFERIDALNQSKGYTESTFTGFPRTDGQPSASPNATSLALNFSSPTYNTQYTYDAASNTYLRSIGGVPSEDREQGRISPSVVVAIKVNMTRVLEDGYRESIQTIGTGEAFVFQNGTVTNATWKKNDRSSPLELIDANGTPIPLVRGQTWIGAIPNNTGSVTWS